MEYSVYILRSINTGQYYIGQTQNLADRIRSHNSGKVKSTLRNLPWELIWSETHATRKSAINRESEIKGWKKRDKIESLINQLVPKLRQC